MGCRADASPTRRCGHLGTHGTLTCSGYEDPRNGVGKFAGASQHGYGIDFGWPSGVKLTGNADKKKYKQTNKKQLLKPRKDTVFPFSPLPRIPKTYRDHGAAGGMSEVGDMGDLCLLGDFGKLTVSVEVLPGSGPWRRFWVLCSPARQLANSSLYLCCPHLGPTLGWASYSLPAGSPSYFSAGPSLILGGERES